MPPHRSPRRNDRRDAGSQMPAEFDQKMVELKRVARVVKGGKRFRFRATVVVGNRKGKVGAGLGKGVDVATAMDKAVSAAKKNIVTIPMDRNTIPHVVTAKLGGSNVLLKPAPKGTGVIAGGAVRAVVELAGIKDILSKMLGSSNQTNNVFATIHALQQLRPADVILMQRNKPARTRSKIEKTEEVEKTEETNVG